MSPALPFSEVPVSKQGSGCSAAAHGWPSPWTLQTLGPVFKLSALQSGHQSLIYRPGFPGLK